MSMRWGKVPARAIRTMILLGALTGSPAAAFCQSYRYMDESGNIFFVDRIEDVPRQHRYQIFGTPTPPVVDKRHPNKPPAKPTKKPKEKKKKKKSEHKRPEVKGHYPSFLPQHSKSNREPPPMPNLVMPTPAADQEAGGKEAGSGSNPTENSASLPPLNR